MHAIMKTLKDKWTITNMTNFPLESSRDGPMRKVNTRKNVNNKKQTL